MKFAEAKSSAERATNSEPRRSARRPAAGMVPFLQPKLKVSHPDSAAEREADHAADHVVAQRLPLFLRSDLESRFGPVCLHTDSRADAAASALDARAFTVGRDIAFAAGEYQPDTAEGRHLLAHELAHVVQQSGGSKGGEATPPLSAAGPSVQRAPVQTLGGKWDTTQYDIVNNGATPIGVDIDLVFTPEDPVNAELIGLTQTARSYSGGVFWGTNPVYANDTAKKRSIPSGDAEGTHIDRLAAYGNPLYAAKKPAAGDTLAGTPTDAFWGQHGWHYVDAMGVPQHQEAILKDIPSIDPPGEDAGQTFESAALAVQGAQNGTFYGSVSWGWQTDSNGAFTKLPLSLVSAGVPSATFMQAAGLWNVSETDAGTPTIALPTSTLASSTTLPANRSTSELVIDIARVTAELAPMVPGTDKTNKEFEKRALEFELAKRADQPTLSLADQERAAALLSTTDLIRRATALPAEISGLAASSVRTDKELEREAVHRAIRTRMLLITVHVHETEDILGADEVYVAARWLAMATSSCEVDLNNGQENTFVISLSDVFPRAPVNPALVPLLIAAYDADWDGDDLMFQKEWAWTELPASETQERDGGRYTVRVDLGQLR